MVAIPHENDNKRDFRQSLLSFLLPRLSWRSPHRTRNASVQAQTLEITVYSQNGPLEKIYGVQQCVSMLLPEMAPRWRQSPFPEMPLPRDSDPPFFDGREGKGQNPSFFCEKGKNPSFSLRESKIRVFCLHFCVHLCPFLCVCVNVVTFHGSLHLYS